MLAGTVLKPGPNVRGPWTFRLPFSWGVQRCIADICDLVFQDDLFSNPIAAPFRRNPKRNIISRNESLILGSERRKENTTHAHPHDMYPTLHFSVTIMHLKLSWRKQAITLIDL